MLRFTSHVGFQCIFYCLAPEMKQKRSKKKKVISFTYTSQTEHSPVGKQSRATIGPPAKRHLPFGPLSARMAKRHLDIRERNGSVVECLTRDRGAAGSSLTGVTALWSLSKTHLS